GSRCAAAMCAVLRFRVLFLIVPAGAASSPGFSCLRALDPNRENVARKAPATRFREIDPLNLSRDGPAGPQSPQNPYLQSFAPGFLGVRWLDTALDAWIGGWRRDAASNPNIQA